MSEKVTVQKKILYWGPGEAGKTTTFQRLKEFFSKHLISKGFSVETTTNRTLWNDSIHMQFELPDFNLSLIIILTTTTGQKRFLNTREYILQNTDGVVFIGDSAPEKLEENQRSFLELKAFLGSRTVPILIILNKRDLPDAMMVETFRKALDLPKLTPQQKKSGRKIIYETVATNRTQPGEIVDSFLEMLQRILQQLVVKPVQ